MPTPNPRNQNFCKKHMKSGILASEVDEREGKRLGLRSKSLQQGFQTRDPVQYRDFSKKVIQIGFFSGVWKIQKTYTDRLFFGVVHLSTRAILIWPRETFQERSERPRRVFELDQNYQERTTKCLNEFCI